MLLIVSLSASMVSSKLTQAPYFYNRQRPLIIAHRGACGNIPEHTLEAYDMARYMGADFIEPDLVPTRDNFLLINHEGLLDETTNVSELPQFSHLLITKTISTYEGDFTRTGWYSEDFYLHELKELSAKQRLIFRPKSFNNILKKITINEALDWVISINQQRILNNQTLLGAYIELKAPAHYNSLGYHVEDMLLKVLKDRNIHNIKGASEICPIIFQCFELESLKYLSRFTDLPLVYLIETGSISLNVSQYQDVVHGVGPDLKIVFNSDGSLTGFVEEALNGKLSVHPYVTREDLPIYKWSRQKMYEYVLEAKLHGVFDEFPSSAKAYFTLKNK